MKSGGPYRTCRLARGRGLSKKSFRSRHESLIWLTGRGGTPHIAGMSLKDTITFALSAAVVFGTYGAIVEWMLHLESTSLLF